MNKIYFFISILFLMNSCSNNTIYSKFKSIENSKWNKDSIISFNIDIKDTLSNNSIFINLRNNKDYEFNNIFLIVGIDYPNNTKIIDTLEYKMTDDRGVFLGTGFTDVKENKLEFKENINFSIAGVYKFNVQQAMRKNGIEEGVEYLNGIIDVGIQIERITDTN